MSDSANTFKSLMPLFKKSYRQGVKNNKKKRKFIKLKELLDGRKPKK